MVVTISESLEKIRQEFLIEFQKFKDELSLVKEAEGAAVAAIKKVLSHFNPAAHVPENVTSGNFV